MMSLREKLEVALAKPVATGPNPDIHSEVFNPWDDVIEGVAGDYSSECDRIMIAALKALMNRDLKAFLASEGLAGEITIYILTGHGFVDYGIGPTGGWPDLDIQDLWGPLIVKWEEYYHETWRDE